MAIFNLMCFVIVLCIICKINWYRDYLAYFSNQNVACPFFKLEKLFFESYVFIHFHIFRIKEEKRKFTKLELFANICLKLLVKAMLCIQHISMSSCYFNISQSRNLLKLDRKQNKRKWKQKHIPHIHAK